MIKLILPKNYVGIIFDKNTRLYFLLGPIRGSFDWQAEAIKQLQQKDPDCYIACPCRYNEDHELFHLSVPDNRNEVLAEMSNTFKYMDDDESEFRKKPPLYPFPDQTEWERHYLELASYYGSIIAWLQCEDPNNRRKYEDGPYGQDTYGELGRWSIKSSQMDSLYDKGHVTARVNFALGAEKGFFGLKVIQRNFDRDHGKPYPIYKSLSETINAAIALAKKPIHKYKDAFFDDADK